MTRRELPPLRRDLVCLILGGAWGTWTALTAGPWPIMLVSAAMCMGPSFVRLWLLGPGTGISASPAPPDSPSPPGPPSLGPSPAASSGADP